MTERCNERFFDMPIGNYCGVLIRESAAKKLQKILWRHTQEIKDFFTQNMDELEASNWTLAYIPEQTQVNYFDGDSRKDLVNRIALLNSSGRLRFVPDVIKTDKTGLEAMNEAKEFYTEHYSKDEGGVDT